MITPEQVHAVTGKAPWMSLELAKRYTEWLQTWKPQRVVELGTLHGVSACYTAAAIREWGGIVATVDLPDSSKNHPNVEFLAEELGLHNISVIRRAGGATAELRQWVNAGLERIHPPTILGFQPLYDLLYIDADHTYESTVVYWALGGLLVSRGGWVIFDDIENDRCPDVRDVWEMAKRSTEWHNAQEWGNWGLIQRRYRE